MQCQKLWRFLQNTLVLTATAMLMRSVSLSFNLYLRERLGDEGIGLFSLVMNLFSFAVTLATGGVSLLTTRLVSEALGKERPDEAKSAFKKCRHYALFFGILAFSLLFFLADPIGRYLLSDERTVPSLKALAISLPFLALSSSFSGYFTATRRVTKSAAVQLSEQFCRIALTVTAFTYLAPKDLTSLCLFVVLGSVVSDVLSCLLSGVIARLDEKRHLAGKSAILPKDFNKKLLAIALPIAFSSYFRSALVTLEHLLIPKGLVTFGMTQSEALAAFGVLEAMALPVVLFPYALLTPFCSLLVPEVAGSMAVGDHDNIKKVASSAMTFTATFGIGTAAVLLTFSASIGEILCGSREAGGLIAALAPLVPIMYTDTAVDSVLKGANEQLFSMRVNLIDSLLGVLLAFCVVPKFGLYGYVFNIILCEIVNFSFSVTRLYQKMPPKLPLFKTVVLPLTAAILSAYLFRLLLPHFPLATKFSLFVGIITLFSLYLGIVFLSRKLFSKNISQPSLLFS